MLFHYAECHIYLFIVVLSLIMLSALMLSINILSAVMLSVVVSFLTFLKFTSSGQCYKAFYGRKLRLLKLS
jgi:hypothetical protein